MNTQHTIDLSACALWRSSIAFGGAHIGIIPAWNAVTLLNPAAAVIWDLLAETADVNTAIKTYAQRVPERAVNAQSDVEACLAAWNDQGLLRTPQPSEEALRLRTIPDRPAAAGEPALRRTVEVAGIPTLLEVEDPALATVVADLVADFPETDARHQHHLQSLGPHPDWVLRLDGRPERVAPDLVFARGQIVSELVRLASGDTSWLATVHGAVLSNPSGAIFLAGVSGAGKSTLSAGLVARGWRILAEDLAAFGPEWTVCPLPFALSIKEGSVDVLRPAFPELDHATIHQLGSRRVRYQRVPARCRSEVPERPQLILEVCFTPEMGTAPARLEPLGALDALALFMNEESFIDFEQDEASGFLDFVEATPAYRLRYGDIAQAERCIADTLDRHVASSAR